MFKKAGSKVIVTFMLIGHSVLPFALGQAVEQENAFLISNSAKEGKLLNLQSWLAVMGFPAGELDGSMGPTTRQAVKDYQKSLKQKETGSLDASWEAPLEKAIRKKVQAKLKALNLYDGEIDALHGNKLSLAIKAYARSKGLESTDTMDAALLATLFNDSIAQNSIETNDTPDNVDADAQEDTAPQTISPDNESDKLSQSNAPSLDTQISVAGKDTSNLKVAAKAVEADKNESKNEQAKIVAKFKGYKTGGDNELALVQLQLTYLGFYDAIVDGHKGSMTIGAIKKFQTANGLAENGKIDTQTQALLVQKSIIKFQEMLIAKKIFTEAPTGSMGAKTLKALHDYQNEHKLAYADRLSTAVLVKILESDGMSVAKAAQVAQVDVEAGSEVSQKTESKVESELVTNTQNLKVPEVLTDTVLDSVSTPKKTQFVFKGYKAGGDNELALVQLQLTYLGFYDAIVDGKSGDITTDAIKQFQRANSLADSGKIDAQTNNVLIQKSIVKFQEMLIANKAFSDAPTGSMGAKTLAALHDYQTKNQLEYANRLSVGVLVKLLDSSNNLASHNLATPKGQKIADKPNTESKVSTESISRFKGYRAGGDDDLALAQLKLAYLGFYDTIVDGKQGDTTTKSLKSFQSKNNISNNGKLDAQVSELLTQKTIIKFQEMLFAKGIIKEAPTGSLGPKTRKAISDYRKSKGVSPLNTLGISSLLLLLDDAKGARMVKEYEALVQSQQTDQKMISQIQSYLIVLGYLSGSANGTLDKATKEATLRFRNTEGLKRVSELNPALLSILQASAIKKLQSNLKSLGYKTSVDGNLGASTKQAIKTYQKKNRLRVTGDYTHMLLAKTNRAKRESEYTINRRAPQSTKMVNRKNSSDYTFRKDDSNDSNDSDDSDEPILIPRVIKSSPDVYINTRLAKNTGSVSNTKNSVNTTSMASTKDRINNMAMPNLNRRVAQENEIIRAEPNTSIQGRMSLLRSGNGQVTGCKISNITISSEWCTSSSNKEGSSCNVLYKNGRVLSVRCR